MKKKPRFSFSKKKISWFALLNLFFLSPALLAGSGVSLQSIDFPKDFGIKSEYYTVSGDVQKASLDGFLKFKVTSSHAIYEVEGLIPLKKILHEVEVIERIKRDKAGSGFVDGAVDSVKATGTGFVNLVAHPVNSAKGIGQATGKLGKTIGGVFRKKEEGEKTSFGETMMGGAKRDLAKQFGVDVYSDNPYLQEILNRMAKSRMGGKGVVAIGSLLIPVGAIASIAMTASNVNSAADQFVSDKSRPDLFHSNQEALITLGFQTDEINALLNHPFYSPREMTYLRFYLEKLQTVIGSREILKAAIKTKSTLEARKVLYEAQLAADFMDEKLKYSRVRLFQEGIAAQSKDRIILFMAYDYLDKSSVGDRVLEKVGEIKKQWGDNPVEIWSGGKITAGFAAVALIKGVKTRSWLFFKA